MKKKKIIIIAIVVVIVVVIAYFLMSGSSMSASDARAYSLQWANGSNDGNHIRAVQTMTDDEIVIFANLLKNWVVGQDSNKIKSMSGADLANWLFLTSKYNFQ